MVRFTNGLEMSQLQKMEPTVLILKKVAHELVQTAFLGRIDEHLRVSLVNFID